jgi:hypothetical protein
MEPFTQFLITGDPGCLGLSVGAFVLAGVLGVLAVRLRPRARR